MHPHADRQVDGQFDPRLDRLLRRLACCGTLAVLLLPAARADMHWLGWMPLWLVAMPLSAWWALHRFALPPPLRRRAMQARVPSLPRRRRGAQARRRPAMRPMPARAA